MKVLIVSSAVNGQISPFVQEQMRSLQSLGIECKVFAIRSGGIKGYLAHLRAFRRTRKAFNPDIIHAHYGLSGLFANFQRRTPVVTTYHGSDLNLKKNRALSKLSVSLSTANIYVTDILQQLAQDDTGIVIPCGVDTEIFKYHSKEESKKKLNLDANTRYVLFPASFNNTVKNAGLAKDAIAIHNNNSSSRLELLELKGMSRQQVAYAINACDIVLLTSKHEGSPQVIKEALSCSSPIVSTGVGSVPKMVNGVEGCYIVSPSVDAVISGIHRALDFLRMTPSTKGRERIASQGLSLDDTARKIIHVYQSTINYSPNTIVL